MKAPRLSVLLPMLVGLLWPAGALALGLGDATVHSRLNEPLSVEISLVRTELSSSNKHVFGIASASAHAAAGIIYFALQPQQAKKDMAPDFTVVTMDGKTITLDSLRGKPLFLNFWSSW